MSSTNVDSSADTDVPDPLELAEDKEISVERSIDETPAKEERPAITFPEGGLKAWLVALGCALVLFSTFGLVNAFGVFQEYYEAHQLRDQSPSTIAWIGSLQTFFMFSGMLFGGPLFDQYGAKCLLPAGLVYVFSLMMTSICKTYYQFLLAQGILGGCSMGLTMGPGLAATGQYFNKKRGAAMGLVVAGSSIGGVIFPIATSRMFANPRLGFGWSIRICGFIILAALLTASSVIRARFPPRRGRFFILAAFKEKAYVSLVTSVFLIMLGLFTPFFYLPTYAVEHGMSTQLASYLVSILNGASFFGRVIPGIMADKLGRLNMLMAVGLVSGILIFCLQKMTTNSTIIVFSALYGFSSGAIVSLISVCLAQIPKNPGDIGTYMGQGMAVVAIGALIGPPSNGALLSRYHSFDRPLIMSGVFVIVGALMVIVAKRTSKKGLFSKS